MKFTDLKNKLKENNLSDIKVKTYVPIVQKAGILPQIAKNVIISEDGYYVIDRVQYELNLYYLLCTLYLNVEFEKDENGIDIFSADDYDALAMYKFVNWLNKSSQNDSFDFIAFFKNSVLDSIRKLNAKNSQFDINDFQKSIDELKNIDPQILKLINFDNGETKKIAREMVDNASRNN